MTSQCSGRLECDDSRQAVACGVCPVLSFQSLVSGTPMASKISEACGLEFWIRKK